MYDFLDQPVSALNRGGQFLLWSIRSWIKASNGTACIPRTLAPTFQRFGMIAGLAQFHAAMALLNRDGLEKVRCGRLCFATVTEDEAVILAIFPKLARGEAASARRTLEMLVTEDAVGPLMASLSVMAAQLAGADLIPKCPVASRVASRS